MREILFRGKAINRDNGYHRTNYKNGDWVYGLITRLYDERFLMLPAEMTDIKGVSGIEVDYKTIGQYTGLTDKNGKKIFEEDIVNVNTKKDETHNMYKGRHLVIRFDEYHRFVASGRLEYPLCNHYEWEAISNIHDNPELLKGDKDNG